jgi:hypothetical protein
MSDLIRREDALDIAYRRSASNNYFVSAAGADIAHAIRALPAVQPDREHIAFSMWKAEADRAAPNVGKNRTPEGFASAAEQERDRWLMLADAAIEAIRKGDQP